MSLFVLDSDTLSLLERDHPQVSVRVASRAIGDVAVSVITVEESLRGWFSMVRKAKNPRRLALAYDRLAGSVTFLSRTRILPFTETAIDRFQQFMKAKLHIGAN